MRLLLRAKGKEMTYENQDRYKQLISDFEAVLQWKRIRELLGSELFSVLETSIIELFVRTVKAENDAREWQAIATRYIVNEVKEENK
jgi:hypothetical protein